MSDKPLNILIVASWYPKEKDLSGVFIKDQAKMLLRSGHKITVLHPYLKGTFLNTLKTRKTDISIMEEEGIKIIRIGVPPVLPLFRNISFGYLNHVVLDILEKEPHQFDLIHSHSLLMGGVIANSISKCMNIPYVHTEHSSSLIFKPEEFKKSDANWLRKVYNDANSVILVSSYFRDQLDSKFNLKNINLKVIGNVIHPEFFRKINIPQERRTDRFLAISNLVPIKGIEFMLDIWKEYLRAQPNGKLTIAGDGPLKEELMRKSVILGIDYSIQWLPKQERAGIIDLLDSNDLLLSTSQFETFGMIAAEAQARGKFVVSTDTGGIRDILEDGTGLILPRESKLIAETLTNLKSLHGQKNPEDISEICSRKFSEEVIMDKLNNLYYQALK